MKQFVKAIEIWVPGVNGMVLELSSAYYGELEDFKRTSETMRFAFGQGLPGKTWATRQAIVLTDLDNSYFQRAEAAHQAGIACAASFPILCGDYLHAVVVLFCGGGEDVVGAMEVWHNPNDSTKELTLVDGYYGELERFEFISRRLTMMYDRGLPGMAWAKGRPVIIDDLGSTNSFLRAANAAKAGITTGLAIPFIHNDSSVQILTLLSAKGTPIARRFEIWMPNASQDLLQFDSGQCHSGDDLKQKYADTVIKKSEGPIGESWITGRPSVANIDTDEGTAMIVLPIISAGSLNSVVCLVL